MRLCQVRAAFFPTPQEPNPTQRTLPFGGDDTARVFLRAALQVGMHAAADDVLAVVLDEDRFGRALLSFAEQDQAARTAFPCRSRRDRPGEGGSGWCDVVSRSAHE
jgi:hypothetical protein